MTVERMIRFPYFMTRREKKCRKKVYKMKELDILSQFLQLLFIQWTEITPSLVEIKRKECKVYNKTYFYLINQFKNFTTSILLFVVKVHILLGMIIKCLHKIQNHLIYFLIIASVFDIPERLHFIGVWLYEKQFT